MKEFNEEEVKYRANGMLPLKTYRRIYEYCNELKPECVLEIGTAHGASAISIARSAIDRGYSTRITTLDPLAGRITSRSKYGDATKNESIIRENFRAFGVNDLIKLYVGTSGDYIRDHCPSTPLDLICLDADGRIDRDILNLLPLIERRTRFIIDDYSEDPKIVTTHNNETWLDLKCCITKRLVDTFVAAGAIKIDEMIGETIFCAVSDWSIWTSKNISELALSAYRELVFVEVNIDTNAKLMNELFAAATIAPAISKGEHIRRSIIRRLI